MVTVGWWSVVYNVSNQFLLPVMYPGLLVGCSTGYIGVVSVPGLLGGNTCAVMQNLH